MRKFDAAVEPYLTGASFHNGLRIRVAEKEKRVGGRLSYLESAAAGKSVIHIGCTDHLPLIDDKIARGTWAHGRISRVAARCIGLDINRETIDHVRTKHGVTNVVCADVSKEAVPEIDSQDWDVVILGEVLEHIDDPVGYLARLHGRLASRAKRLVLTGPNAFAYLNVFAALRGEEFINTDHRYWFSPYTVAKLLVRAGYKPESVGFCEANDLPEPRPLWRSLHRPRAWLRDATLMRYPALREIVLVESAF